MPEVSKFPTLYGLRDTTHYQQDMSEQLVHSTIISIFSNVKIFITLTSEKELRNYYKLEMWHDYLLLETLSVSG
jgi:hypothetical protein